MPLAEARLVGPEDERHVCKNRRRYAYGLVQHHLLRRIGEMVSSANDVGHPHFKIVHHHTEVVCGYPVGAQQNEILDLAVGKLNVAEDSIVEKGASGLWHGEANGADLSCFATGSCIGGRDEATLPVI